MSTDSPDYFDSFSGVFGESESAIVSSSPAGTGPGAYEEVTVVSGTRNWYDKPFSIASSTSVEAAPSLGTVAERALGSQSNARQEDYTRALGAQLPGGRSMPDTRFESLGEADPGTPQDIAASSASASTGKDLLKVMGVVCLGLWALNELGAFESRGKK